MGAESAVQRQQAASNAVWIKRARQWHLYLGILFAPSILFFALSGSLQLFGLHESHPGDSYQAPAWIQKMASIHKDQNIEERHGPPPGAGVGPAQAGPPGPREAPGGGRGEEGHRRSGYTLALKWFFLGTALGLTVSTLLGIYMAFKFGRSRVLVWGLLVAGTVIPAALLVLMA